MTDSSTEIVDPAASTQTDSTTQVSDSTPVSSTETKPAETILDRVRATYEKSNEATPASTAPGKSAVADDSAKSTAPEDGKDLTPDEMKLLAPRTQERFQRLTADLKAQGKELETLKPKAAEYDKIEAFIRQNGLAPRDVQSISEIAAMLVHNPAGARARLAPIMAELDKILGNVLPADLQEQVDQGYITPEHAQALSRAQAEAGLATRRANAITESQQQNETITRQRAAIDSSLSAMDAWEKQTAAKDPDWHQKQSEVSNEVELAIGRESQKLGRPWFPSAQEANKLLADAYDTVNARHKRFAPKPVAITPPAAGGASPRSNPAPKNTMDIIRGQLNR